MQRMMLTGPGKAACRVGGMWQRDGGEQQQGAWGTRLPDRTLILDDSAKKPRITSNEVLE